MKRTFINSAAPNGQISVETPYATTLRIVEEGQAKEQVFETEEEAFDAHVEFIQQRSSEGWREEAPFRWFHNPATGERIGLQPPVSTLFKSTKRSNDGKLVDQVETFTSMNEATLTCCARITELLDQGWGNYVPSLLDVIETFGRPPSSFAKFTEEGHSWFANEAGRELGPEHFVLASGQVNGLHQLNGKAHGWTLMWRPSGVPFQMAATLNDNRFGPEITFFDDEKGYDIFWKSNDDKGFYRAVSSRLGAIVGEQEGEYSPVPGGIAISEAKTPERDDATTLKEMLTARPSVSTWRRFVTWVGDGGLSPQEESDFGEIFDAWPEGVWRICPNRWVGLALKDDGDDDYLRAVALCNAIEIYMHQDGHGPTDPIGQINMLCRDGAVEICNELISKVLALPLPRLRALSLGGEIDSEGLQIVAKAPILGQVRHLELGLEGTEVGALLKAPFVENLLSLSLLINDDGAPTGFEQLQGRTFALENLGLSYICETGDELQALHAAFPKLKRLVFGSAKATKWIALWSSSLEWLSLSSGYGAKELKPVVSASWPVLKHLDLNCNNVGTSTLRSMAKTMPALEHLHLDRLSDHGKTKIDANAIAVLAQEQFANLKGLNFESFQIPRKDMQVVWDTILATPHLAQALTSFRSCSGTKANWTNDYEVLEQAEKQSDERNLAPYDDMVVPLRVFRREDQHHVRAHYWLEEPDEDGYVVAVP